LVGIFIAKVVIDLPTRGGDRGEGCDGRFGARFIFDVLQNPTMRNRIILLVGLLGLGTLIGGWGALQNGLLGPWCEIAAELSAKLMHLFGSNVIQSGAVLLDPQTQKSIMVSRGCSGAVATFILVASIIVYPSCWRAKVLGIITGYMAVQGLNVTRIITLFQLNIYSEQLFGFAHAYLWQGLLMLDVLVFLLLWLGWQKDQFEVVTGLSTNRIAPHF
jgi:exosortase H (IPTLxxWG-CTERM-specific)